MAAAFFFILVPTVRQRTYRILPSETDQMQFAEGYRAYHQGQSLAGEALEEAIVKDLRAVMVDELAQATEQNREINRKRLAGRSNAIFYTLASLGLAVLAVALMFVTDRFDRSGSGTFDASGRHQGRSAAGSGGQRPVREATAPAPAPAGSAASRRRSRAGVDQKGSAMSNDEQKPDQASPPTQPEPASQALRPERPAPGYLKKSEDDGEPI